MGLYIMINETDRKSMRQVTDNYVKEIFDEAQQYDKSLMIWEHFQYRSRGWFRKEERVRMYYLYHEQYLPNGNPAFEARQMMCGSGNKQVVLAYLYGIINGYLHAADRQAHTDGRRED